MQVSVYISAVCIQMDLPSILHSRCEWNLYAKRVRNPRRELGEMATAVLTNSHVIVDLLFIPTLVSNAKTGDG